LLAQFVYVASSLRIINLGHYAQVNRIIEHQCFASMSFLSGMISSVLLGESFERQLATMADV
jgi:hypothetical protein